MPKERTLFCATTAIFLPLPSNKHTHNQSGVNGDEEVYLIATIGTNDGISG